MYYAGIGSRETPDDILFRMKTYAKVLAKLGYTLRSGGADGADSAFERGCTEMKGEKEIYLPWKNFNNNKSTLFEVSDTALEMAKQVYGPRWKVLKQSVRRLHARNLYQVLGATLDSPSSFILCWTPDGCESVSTRTKETGGTGQAIACATMFPGLYEIPVFNLKNANAHERFIEHIQYNERSGDLQ